MLSLQGSLATSDAFIDAFVTKGLNRDAICPCSGSPEALTLSLRRSAHNVVVQYVVCLY